MFFYYLDKKLVFKYLLKKQTELMREYYERRLKKFFDFIELQLPNRH